MSSTPSYRDRLLAIYEAHAPAKAHQVDALLRKYQGREEALIAAAAQKYEAHRTPTAAHLTPPPHATPLADTPQTEGQREPHVSGTSAAAAGSISSPGPSTSSALRDPQLYQSYHDRLKRIYEAYSHRRVAFVDHDLAKYPGREEDVIRAAVKKYGPEPVPSSQHTEATEAVPHDGEGRSPPETLRTRAESEATPDYRARVTALYSQYAPQRLPRVEHELIKYKGREDALIRAIEAKYVSPSTPCEDDSSTTLTAKDSARDAGDVPRVVDEGASVLRSQIRGLAEDPRSTDDALTSCEVNAASGPPATVTTAAPVTTTAVEEAPTDYRARVTALYSQYAPQRLPRVEHELIKYKGREDALIRAIETKYVSPSTPTEAAFKPSAAPDPEVSAAEAAASHTSATREAIAPREPSAPQLLFVKEPVDRPVGDAEADADNPEASSAAAVATPHDNVPFAVEEAAAVTNPPPPSLEVVFGGAPVAAPARDGEDAPAQTEPPEIHAGLTCVGESNPESTAANERVEEEERPRGCVVLEGALHETPPEAVRFLTAAHGGGGDESQEIAEDAEGQDDMRKAGAVTVPPAEMTPLFELTPGEGPPVTAVVVASTPAASPSCEADECAPTPEQAPASQLLAETPPLGASPATLRRRAAFSLPGTLMHDVFSSLGTTNCSGVPSVDQTTCKLLLHHAVGIDLLKVAEGEPSRAIADAVDRYLSAEFISETQFVAFVYAYGTSQYWTDREAAYRVRRCEAFVKKCQSELMPSPAIPTRSTRAPLPYTAKSWPVSLLELPADVARELRSGFWLHYCVFPCVLPSWKRTWACLNVQRADASTGGSAAAGLLSRLSICYPGSTKVDLAIPFRKLVACVLECVPSSMSGTATGGGAPLSPAYRKNGLTLRLADGSTSLELRVCCEEMQHTQGILKAYQLWRARVSDEAFASGAAAVSREDRGATPSSARRPPRGEHSLSANSLGEVSAIVSDPVLRELTWVRVWVSQGQHVASSGSDGQDAPEGGAGFSVGPNPQLFAWAFYGNRLLHTKLGRRAGAAATPIATAPVWDVEGASLDATVVDELPIEPPTRPNVVYHPFMIDFKDGSRQVYAWAESRADRAAIVGQLKRLELRRRLLLSNAAVNLAMNHSAQPTERTLYYSPGPLAGATPSP